MVIAMTKQTLLNVILTVETVVDFVSTKISAQSAPALVKSLAMEYTML